MFHITNNDSVVLLFYVHQIIHNLSNALSFGYGVTHWGSIRHQNQSFATLIIN